VSDLTAQSPLAGITKSWEGLTLSEPPAFEIVSLAIAQWRENEVAKTFATYYGSQLPKPNELATLNEGHALWTGPEQYFLLFKGEDETADLSVSDIFHGAVYTTLQSDSWVAIDLNGTRIYDALEQFISLDLRRAKYPFAARTSAHHMAVIVTVINVNEVRLLTPRSSVQSFLDALTHAIDNALGH
jgi:heterotetrameric sarcosine oxidase gamma subunit